MSSNHHASGKGRGSGRRGGPAAPHRYPRVARVNEVLRQVIAEELERLADTDERFGLLTVTAVEADPDFKRATVLFSSLDEQESEAVAAARPRLQAAVARQVRLKWTPLLSFEADPAIAGGQRVEDILRRLHAEAPAASPAEPARETAEAPVERPDEP